MRSPSSIVACSLIFLAVAAGVAKAQSTSADVTLDVPLNLTNLASDITKVRVNCTLRSQALDRDRVGEAELPVSGGQVVATAHVLVLVPSSALSPTAKQLGSPPLYTCTLSGYSPAVGWGQFGTNSMQSTSFRVTVPGPSPPSQGQGFLVLSGSFTW